MMVASHPAGQVDVALSVGAENMSSVPFHVDGNKVRWGIALGQVRTTIKEDACLMCFWLTCQYGGPADPCPFRALR